MAEIIVDDSLFPVVLIRFPREWTSRQWDVHLARVLAVTARGPCVIVNDARRAPMPNAKERRTIAEGAQTPHFRRNVKAVGIVINNPALRAVVTLMSWVVPPPCPQEHFATAVEAEEWCRKHLDERRVA